MPEDNYGDHERKFVSPFFKTPDTAAMLGIKPDTLKKMRYAGKGLNFRRHGGTIVYHAKDILNERHNRAEKGLYVPEIDTPLEDIVSWYESLFG